MLSSPLEGEFPHSNNIVLNIGAMSAGLKASGRSLIPGNYPISDNVQLNLQSHSIASRLQK